ncbi:S8 family serine peptidase [Clostridium oceanicum]|uniref:S8 family serine peptidase n=1 Tax=Clostridium oceanicum TaxID=1543 RepID=A0ABN1JRX3_9CLOT
MFPLKNKLDNNLKISIKNNFYRNYRVLVIYKSLQKDVEKKIKIYKGEIIHSISTCNCVCAYVNSRAINRLAELPQVSYITSDIYANLCGNSVLPSNKVVLSEKYRLTGKNIGIGLVDSGVYPHADLLSPRKRIKYFLDLINDYKYPYDDNGHGTFISGMIGGNGTLSKGTCKGVAPDSHICMIKAFNSAGKGYVSDILFAIENLINNKDEFNIKVICLPFEITSNDYNILKLFSNLFSMARKNNIIVVVPSGHNGNKESSISGIAILKDCITVGGIDTTGIKEKPYPLSSSGPFSKLDKPNLCAAACNLYSLNTNKNYISERAGRKIYPRSLEEPYTVYSGTSCSAAYISGLCALLFENNIDLTYEDTLSLMKVSCDFLEMSKWIQGLGVIDINKLLQ